MMQFNYHSSRIAKFSNQITNQITAFQIVSLYLKVNR